MSRSLILCYAVECGLKHLIMRKNMLNDTAQWDQQAKDQQIAKGLHHDLRLYLNEARLPAQTITISDSKAKKRAACRESQQVQAHQFHEAFRYGVELDNESHLVEQLERVLTLIERLP